MKNRFTLFRRGKVFYFEDRETKLQKSLGTQDLGQARKIVQAKNDAINQPMMNLVMAKTFLVAKDPKLITRTWEDVLERFCDRSNANTRMRHERVAVIFKSCCATDSERVFVSTWPAVSRTSAVKSRNACSFFCGMPAKKSGSAKVNAYFPDASVCP